MTDASSQSELPKLPLENPYLDDSKSLKVLENGSELLEINASGHIQEVDRNFSLLSIIALGIVAGNTWTALGGAIVVAIYNGGAPGAIYEYITVSVFYWLVAASIAELASALPSAAGVYHWASITPGKRWGRPIGFFAGYWNFFAWIFACAANSSIIGQIVVQMYSIYHPDFIWQRWHVFIAYIVVTWMTCLTVMFMNKSLPLINQLGMFFILAGFLISTVVCAIMPSKNGNGYATNEFVWQDFQNDTGYSSSGLVFCLGMLNGAFAVGTPDCVTHVAEEIPMPNVNIPKAIFAQVVVGFFTALFYAIAIFYAISDLDIILSTSDLFPLAAIYQQATGSRGGALGLLIILLIPVYIATIGTYTIAGRTLWSISRDNATPFADHLSSIHPSMRNPFNATLACGVISTLMACIYVGSSTAFNAFIGSFVILTTLSYTAAILPYLVTRRKHVVPGPFSIPGIWGDLVNGIACLYMIVFMVLYCFPFGLPITPENMNYASLITGGLTLFVVAWWFVKAKDNYVGPIIGKEVEIVGVKVDN